MLVTSKRNQIDDLVPSVTIDLHATSDQPVQVTVSEDRDEIVESVGKFVERFNSVVDTLNKYDDYDQETEERGVLLGDPTVSTVRNAIFRKISSRDGDLTGQFKSLSEIGITVGEGAKLELDEDKLRQAMDTDAEAVQTLFTLKETETDEITGEEEIVRAGIGVEIDQILDRLTDSQSGALQNRLDSIDRQIGLNEDRIEAINEQLEAKREQLRAEFIAMEQSIAQLQGQQQALSGLQSVANRTGGGGGMSSLQQLSQLG
ncbi:MAG: flagellar filament capping protein FliD, partial [Phycisphaeraceae bacterium]